MTLTKEQKIESRKKTTAKYRSYNRATAQDYILNNYEWYIFNSCRNRCKRLGIEYYITVEDIVIPEVCPYLLTPITRTRYQGRQDTNASLDRIDPTKGYVKGNIEVISDKANRMKNNASVEELVTFAQQVLKRYELSKKP